MYKKIFVKNNSDFEFQATPVYFFIDFEVMHILGHDFGERIKDSLIKQDMIRTMAYIKNLFLYTAHVFIDGKFVLIANRLNEFADPIDFYNVLNELMSDGEKFGEFLNAIIPKYDKGGNI